ncbi:MAG: type II toxin-antitoxin system RelE/ParE family toxin [Xenococcus sp. (in: cyanobacteria)]
MKILWLSDARQDIKNIFLHILDRNPAAARRIRGRIYQAVKGLANNPKIGRPGRVFGTRELVISQTSYIVAYRVRNDAVEILQVIHGARSWEQAFGDNT